MGADSSPGSPGFPRQGGPSETLVVLALIALALPFFFFGLGALALLDPDEPYYAVSALEMLRGGSWIVPVFHGHPWFDKPVLFYWIVLAAYRFLGVSEGAARLGSALAGLGGVLTVYALGRRMSFSKRSAFASAFILATSLGYAILARAAVTDMTLTLALTLGMLATARYLATGAAVTLGLAGLAFGVAALTKGPVGLVLPGVALAAYALLARRPDLLRLRALAAGATGLLLSAGPWYAYMALRYPDLLVKQFLGAGNFGRFLSPEHPAFPLYYVVVLAMGLLPWSGALPVALARFATSSTWISERGERKAPGMLYLICWFGAVLLVFTLSASKLSSYVLPAYPPAALMLGAFWSEELGAGRRDRRAALAVVLGLLVAAATAVALVWATESHGAYRATPEALVAGGLIVGGSLCAALAVRRGSLDALLFSQGGAALATLGVVLLVALPRLEPFHSTRPLVRLLEERRVAGEVIAAYDVPDISLDYYLGRSLVHLHDEQELRRLVDEKPGRIWVVRTDELASLPARADARAEEVWRGPSRSAVRLSPSNAHAERLP